MTEYRTENAPQAPADDSSEAWGTSQQYDSGDGRHALPEQHADDAATTSYGVMFDHPPYHTEAAPMMVELPEPAPTVPRPQPARPAPEPPVRQETVSCPECGTVQQVNLNRRDATDFCRRCDFPLFWTPARVDRDWSPESNGESLRRLPGTGGSARLASAACPHCAELNAATAEVCSRCGQSMHVQAPPPPPAPVYVPPPPPPPAPEPERGIPWWVWVAGGSAIVVILLVALYLTDVIRF